MTKAPHLLILLFLPTAFAFAATDVFEQIAQEKTEFVPGVIQNPPPALPDITLPWNTRPVEPFEPAEKMRTQTQLDAELKKMRERYEPFLKDLAPSVDTRRKRIELKEFDWRYETPEDKADIAHPQQGEGRWEKVKIPHYWGPMDDATSYYRTEVDIPAAMIEQGALVVHFQGVDYIADVYINGHHLGSHEGLFDAFEFDIRPHVNPGRNVLLVKVVNASIQMGSNFDIGPNRKYGKKFAAAGGPGWDEAGKGWHLCPPGFGIYQRAWIESRAASSVKDIFVRPLPQKNLAELWLEVSHGDNEPVEVSYSLYGQNFKALLAENEKVSGTPQVEPDGTRLYKVSIPISGEQLRWWSPDEPWLYQIQVQLRRDGKVLDRAKKQFGMRTFVQSQTSTPKGRFYLNGKEVRLRGALMMGNLMQCVIRGDLEQLRDDILIAKVANLNFWRMLQQPCQEEVYDYFDRLGMMAQSDLPIFVGVWREQAEEGLRQAGALERLVRSHPSNIIVSYINEPIFDFAPKMKGVMMPREELRALFHRYDKSVLSLNPDQVIKWVDGDYPNFSEGYSDHHCYSLWYRGHGLPFREIYRGAWIPSREGWMRGCGEYGAEGLESIEFMKKNFPKEWTEVAPDGSWSPKLVTRNQTERLGPPWFGFTPRTMEEWVEASQNHQYWALRLGVDTIRRDPYMNSFAGSLLMDAWPAGWLKHIMDSDRQAKRGFYAYRDALAPLRVNLRPDRFYYFSGEPVRIGTWICNDTQDTYPDATLRYQVKLGGRVVKTGEAPAKIGVCIPEFEGFLKFDAPEVDKRQPVEVEVGLFDRDGKNLNDDSYVLDLLPASDKPPAGQRPLEGAGGYPQRMLDL